MSKSSLTDWPANLIAEWHPDKNNGLAITDATPGSGINRWWLDSKGHEWESKPNARTSQKQNCPYCANKRVLAGFNDFASQEPEMAREFHPTRNTPLTAAAIIVGSAKKLWWQCELSHEWVATANNRVFDRSGCPYCANKRVLAGFNDLQTTHPEKAKRFDSVKNAPLTASDVIAGSHKKMWWKDESGHEWEEPIGQYVAAKKVDCVECEHPKKEKVVKPVKKKLPVSEIYPELFKQLDPKLNPGVKLDELSIGVHTPLNWKDEKGHVWEAKLYSRTTSGNGCPFCSGRNVIPGETDLLTLYPEVAAQLHPTKNGDVTADKISAFTNRRLWWLDDFGHEWLAQVSRRNSENGRGCPVCSGHLIVPGINDLGSQEPLIAAQLHPTKNGDVTADQIPAKGGRWKLWWLCEKGHEWKTPVKGRVLRKAGCPECWATTYSSRAELEVGDFLESLGLTVERTNRSLLHGVELDMYILEKKFAIEFNGLYWHSELAGRDRNYHHEKWLAAKNAGVQLLQIWEDDWISRKPVILRALAHKLGVSEKLGEVYPELAENVAKVFARKTVVVPLATAEAKAFLDEHHVQGFAAGSYYLGLQDAEQTVRAVLALKKESEGKVLNIVRYATFGTVVGGFTKLLAYAEKTYAPESFITFADHCVSDGGLYENNGFVVDKELRPDYMYIVGKERKHKFGYRLVRFENDPNLKFEAGMTERELAELNTLPRIWDAGKTRYRKTVS